jgi:hypothetical protein
MMKTEYSASLIIDGQKNAGADATDLESVASAIFHYASLYLDDGFNKTFVVKITKKQKEG